MHRCAEGPPALDKFSARGPVNRGSQAGAAKILRRAHTHPRRHSCGLTTRRRRTKPSEARGSLFHSRGGGQLTGPRPGGSGRMMSRAARAQLARIGRARESQYVCARGSRGGKRSAPPRLFSPLGRGNLRTDRADARGPVQLRGRVARVRSGPCATEANAPRVGAGGRFHSFQSTSEKEEVISSTWIFRFGLPARLFRNSAGRI